MKRLLLFVMMSFVSVLFGVSPEKIEKGDIIYRDLNVIGLGPFYHGGIYRYFVVSSKPDPLDSKKHRIKEQTGKGVKSNTLYNFKKVKDYHGGRTPKLNLTTEQRNKILSIAKSKTLMELKYVGNMKDTMIKWEDTNKNGKLDINGKEIKGIRSDGWVELVYALAGIKIQGDIINNTNWYNRTNGGWTALTPKTQYNAMKASKGYAPELKVLNYRGQQIPNGGITDKPNISIKASDKNDGTGSGISYLEIWQGNPDNKGKRLKYISEKYDDTTTGVIERAYSSSEIGNLPKEVALCARSCDQAGNYTDSYFTITEQSSREGIEAGRVGNGSCSGHCGSICDEEIDERVSYANSAWGQEFTGSHIHSGYPRFEPEPGCGNVWLSISKEKVPVTSKDVWTFNLTGCGGGGLGAHYVGGFVPEAAHTNIVDVILAARNMTFSATFFDSSGKQIAMYPPKGETGKDIIYSYDSKQEYLAVYVWNGTTYQFNKIEKNPDFEPEKGLKVKRIVVAEVLKQCGVKNPDKVKYANIDMGTGVGGGWVCNEETGPGPYLSGYVWFSVGIEGIDFGLDKSSTMKQTITGAPGQITNSNKPTISGKVNSSGGNINGVWARYDYGKKGGWIPVTPKDGAFNGIEEEFEFIVPEALSAGYHSIEIKALNASGEKDAVYSTIRFKVDPTAVPSVPSTPVADDGALPVTERYGFVGRDKVSLSGLLNAQGLVRSMGEVNLRVKAYVAGDVLGKKVKISKWSKVQGKVTNAAESFEKYPVDLGNMIEKAGKENDNANIPKTQKKKPAIDKQGRLVINSGDKLTLPGGTYYVGGINMLGSAELKTAGAVKIVCMGDIKMIGNIKVNTGGKSEDLEIYVSTYVMKVPVVKSGTAAMEYAEEESEAGIGRLFSATEMKELKYLAGTESEFYDGDLLINDNGEILSKSVRDSEIECAEVYAATKKARVPKLNIGGKIVMNGLIYAPESAITCVAYGTYKGYLFGKSISITGKMNMSVPAGAITTAKGARAIEFSLAGPDTEFLLGEVYAFPNPAKRGKNPTIHIECGLADRIDLKIYDTAADIVHMVQLGDEHLMLVEDKYAYEYTWDISGEASGVYIFVSRAKKEGVKDIKASGKIAVIK